MWQNIGSKLYAKPKQVSKLGLQAQSIKISMKKFWEAKDMHEITVFEVEVIRFGGLNICYYIRSVVFGSARGGGSFAGQAVL